MSIDENDWLKINHLKSEVTVLIPYHRDNCLVEIHRSNLAAMYIKESMVNVYASVGQKGYVVGATIARL